MGQKPPEFITETCPKCGKPHALRWIDPPGAWFGDCPQLLHRAYEVNGEKRVDFECLPNLRPDGKLMILKPPSDSVTNYRIQMISPSEFKIDHVHRAPGEP